MKVEGVSRRKGCLAPWGGAEALAWAAASFIARVRLVADCPGGVSPRGMSGIRLCGLMRWLGPIA